MTLDIDSMLARAQSSCFDLPQPGGKPQETSEPQEERGDPELLTLIVDALRDYHDAFTA